MVRVFIYTPVLHANELMRGIQHIYIRVLDKANPIVWYGRLFALHSLAPCIAGVLIIDHFAAMLSPL